MKHSILNKNQLEKEMASVETDAVAEEQYNADKNYNALDTEYKIATAAIPYPQTEPYTTGFDYDDYARFLIYFFSNI